MSGILGKSFLSRVQHLPQLHMIYVVGGAKGDHDAWTKNQLKIRLVCSDVSEILDHLGHDIETTDKEIIEYTIYQSGAEGNITQFAYFQLLYRCILHSNDMKNAQTELLSFSREQYAGNESATKLIAEFEETLVVSKAVWWFTRPASFIAKMIARGLRSPEPDILYKTRMFIQYLHQQLQSEFNLLSNRTVFFRSRAVSRDELENLRRSTNGLLCFSAFLFASTEMNAGPIKVNSNNKDQRIPIFFKIKIDCSAGFRSCASINQLCYEGTSVDGVLFSMSTVFRIMSVERSDDDGMYCVVLTVVSDDDKQLRQAIAPLEQRVIDGSPLVRLTDLMAETDQYPRVDLFADIILQDKSSANEVALTKLSKIYHALGTALYKKRKLDEAIGVLTKSLEIQLLFTDAEHHSLTSTYNNMGSIHLKQSKFDLALEYHNKALNIQLKSGVPDPESVAAYSDNIGSVYMEQRKYKDALPHLRRALKIREQTLGSENKEVIGGYHRLAGIYWKAGKYSEALEYYQMTLKGQLKTLPSDHPSIAATYYNTATAYEGLGMIEDALKFAQKSVEQILKTLPESDSNSQENVALVKKLKQKIWVKGLFNE